VVKEINKVDIFCGHPIQTCDAFNCVSAFCDRMTHAFALADLVVIEKQFIDNKIKLSSCLSVVQTVLQCRSYQKNVLIHAATIKKVFQTHRGTHKMNKLAAVERATAINPILFNSLSGKMDDMADAFLLAWYAHTHLRNVKLNYTQKFPKPPVSKGRSTSENGKHSTGGGAAVGRGEEADGWEQVLHTGRSQAPGGFGELV
jgi:Holliday junction resolvasome RuvABC endonuclease subunit